MNATTSLLDMADDLEGLDAGDTVTPLVGGHPFEVKGLGLPPFRCTGVDLADRASCAYCGTSIKWAYSILSFDRRGFVVGSECVLKSGASVDGFADQKRRLDRDQRQQQKARRLAREADQWRADHPAHAAWLASSSHDFAKRMTQCLGQWGSLTEGQAAAILRFIEGAKKLETIKAERAVEAQQRLETAHVIDISRIATAFDTAKSKGLKWPKLRLSNFIFKPASSSGRNPGAIYVTQASNDEYLGMVREGRFVRSRQCSGDAESKVLEVCNDPAKAAEAYGRLTGNCAVCARKLTDPKSVARAIGPICAEKFGW